MDSAFNHCYSPCQYLLIYSVLFHNEIMFYHWVHFKLNIFIFMSSQVLSPHHTWHCKRMHHFSAAYDNKINTCGFKFSVVCKLKTRIIHCNLPNISPPPFYTIRYLIFTTQILSSLYSLFCIPHNGLYSRQKFSYN